VLAAAGGTLGRLLPLFKLGLGGTIGGGRQWWSWISLDDQVGSLLHSLRAETLHGPTNATAPNPVTNAEFTKALGRVVRRPTVLPVPAPALSVVLGGERSRELVLASQRVLPVALERSGYVFRHPTLDEALRSLLVPPKGD